MASRVHPAQRVERRAGADAAVDPEGIDAGRRQRGRDEFRRAAIGEAQLLAERHRCDDRQAGGGPDLADRQQQLVEIVEGLEDQQVHATFEEPVELLAKDGPGGGVADPQVAVRGATERAHRPGDQGIPPGNVACLARELGTPAVEPGGQVAQAPVGEPDPVRAERRGLHEVRTGVEILAVDRPHEVRPRQDQLVEAGALGDSAREEQGAGRAVGDEGPTGEARAKPVALRRAHLALAAVLAHRAIVPRTSDPARRCPAETRAWPRPAAQPGPPARPVSRARKAPHAGGPA